MLATPLRTLASRLTDPFDFATAFRDLSLSAEDLPSLTRECRMAGYGS